MGLYLHIPHDEGIEEIKEALLIWDSNVDNGRKLGESEE